MSLRYRPDEGGKAPYRTYNQWFSLAVGRTVIAIIENYQQADGSVLYRKFSDRIWEGLHASAPRNKPSFAGGVAEWSKAAVLKTADPRGSEGSNPSASALLPRGRSLTGLET